MLLIAAWARGNRPDHLAILLLGTRVHAGVTGIARYVNFLAMQQLIVGAEVELTQLPRYH